jgi:hypothetical protein
MALFFLTNDFHGTEVAIRTERGRTLSAPQVARARKALCPAPGCTCGGALGERGKQACIVEAFVDGTVKIWNPLKVGAA